MKRLLVQYATEGGYSLALARSRGYIERGVLSAISGKTLAWYWKLEHEYKLAPAEVITKSLTGKRKYACYRVEELFQCALLDAAILACRMYRSGLELEAVRFCRSYGDLLAWTVVTWDRGGTDFVNVVCDMPHASKFFALWSNMKFKNHVH